MDRETKLKIKVIGDDLLRKSCVEVEEINSSHREILSEMARLMYDFSGVGLAASQVGIDHALIVVDAGTGLYKLINPKIVKKEGTQVMEEGCLSIPGISIKVKRAQRIIVDALDENGKPVVIEAEDLLACVFQHEVDHLKGALIIDYASFFDKLKIKKQLDGLMGKRRMDEGMFKSKTKSGKLQL